MTEIVHSEAVSFQESHVEPYASSYHDSTKFGLLITASSVTSLTEVPSHGLSSPQTRRGCAANIERNNYIH